MSEEQQDIDDRSRVSLNYALMKCERHETFLPLWCIENELYKY